MDFFAHQDQARKSTRRFMLLYTAAVISICLSVGLLFVLVSIAIGDGPAQKQLPGALLIGGVAAGVTALIVVCGSAYRIRDLRGGGASVARGLGGIYINPSTRDPDERRVLNVVEEMAIASGVPVPPVFMMPNEKRINAFAAGYAPGDAVIGVTRGCVEGLTRDELQGVMAHEFSHILNGDMRLNIRMIGFLNGILIITIAGQLLFEASPHVGRSREGAAFMFLGLIVAICLIVIGSIGALSSRIIQSAVSRQREYLADASAVQFTRNPHGIADALRRIGGSAGGKIRHPRVDEASHMFFSQAKSLSATLATHPPLKQRIKRVLPSWDGTFLDPLIPSDRKDEKKTETPGEVIGRRIEDALGGDGADVEGLLPLLALSGMMTPKHIEHAKGLIGEIPESLREAAHDPYSGRGVIYALLLDRKDAELRKDQIEHLGAHADPAIARVTMKLADEAVGLRRELRLPLLDMTLGALAHLSDEQHRLFRRNVETLIKMDKSIDLFEWVTMNMLKRHLDERFGLAKPLPVQYYNLNKLGHEVSVLLSMLAHTGSKDEYDASEAVLMGESAVRGIGVRLLPPEEANMRALDTALKTLNECTARVKKQLLQAAALVVGADHEVTTNEAELLRTIADTLGVPTPPLLPGQKLV